MKQPADFKNFVEEHFLKQSAMRKLLIVVIPIFFIVLAFQNCSPTAMQSADVVKSESPPPNEVKSDVPEVKSPRSMIDILTAMPIRLDYDLDEDTVFQTDVLPLDIVSSDLSVIVTFAPKFGTLNLSNDGKKLIYTPQANFFGFDSATVNFSKDGKIFSKTFNFNVNGIADRPRLEKYDYTFDITSQPQSELKFLVTNDDGAESFKVKILSANSPNWLTGKDNITMGLRETNLKTLFSTQFASKVTEQSTVTFSLVNQAGLESSPVTLTLNVKPPPPNQPSPKSLSVDEDKSLTINFEPPSHFDGDNSSVSYHIESNPQNGIVTINGQSATYTPKLNFYGNDSFTFYVNSPNGKSNAAKISIAVLGVQDSPVAVADQYTFQEDCFNTGPGGCTMQLLTNDSDVDGDQLQIIEVSTVQNGYVSIESLSKSVRFWPTKNYFGTQKFTYKISDGRGNQASAEVNLIMTAVDDLQQIENSFIVLDQSAKTWWSFLVSDPDLDPVSEMKNLTANTSQFLISNYSAGSTVPAHKKSGIQIENKTTSPTGTFNPSLSYNNCISPNTCHRQVSTNVLVRSRELVNQDTFNADSTRSFTRYFDNGGNYLDYVSSSRQLNAFSNSRNIKSVVLPAGLGNIQDLIFTSSNEVKLVGYSEGHLIKVAKYSFPELVLLSEKTVSIPKQTWSVETIVNFQIHHLHLYPDGRLIVLNMAENKYPVSSEFSPDGTLISQIFAYSYNIEVSLLDHDYEPKVVFTTIVRDATSKINSSSITDAGHLNFSYHSYTGGCDTCGASGPPKGLIIESRSLINGSVVARGSYDPYSGMNVRTNIFDQGVKVHKSTLKDHFLIIPLKAPANSSNYCFGPKLSDPIGFTGTNCPMPVPSKTVVPSACRGSYYGIIGMILVRTSNDTCYVTRDGFQSSGLKFNCSCAYNDSLKTMNVLSCESGSELFPGTGQFSSDCKSIKFGADTFILK